MGKSHRAERLGGEIRRIVSNMLLRGDLKDPAFDNMIGISDVHVSGDGSYATLYVSVMSYSSAQGVSDETKKAVIDAFEKSSGYIRSVIGKGVKVRYVPELIFRIDESFDYGAKMDRILDSLDIKPAEEGEAVLSDDFDEFAEEFDK